MQYLVSIATRSEVVIKTEHGPQHRANLRVTHVPMHNRKHAELIAEAINESATGFRMSASTYDAEVSVRLYIRKGSIVLSMDDLNMIATEANNILSSAD